MDNVRYRDYFSLKTLHRFGVEPDRTLHTDGAPEDVKKSILSAFGDVSEADARTLGHKTDCALYDLHVIEPAPERETIEVSEAAEERAPVVDVPLASAPERERGLSR